MSTRHKNIELWKHQDKEHERLIKEFNHIKHGKGLSVGKAKDARSRFTVNYEETALEYLKNRTKRGFHRSLNLSVRENKLRQIDHENIRFLDKISQPKGTIDFGKHEQDYQTHNKIKSRLMKDNKVDADTFRGLISNPSIGLQYQSSKILNKSLESNQYVTQLNPINKTINQISRSDLGNLS